MTEYVSNNFNNAWMNWNTNSNMSWNPNWNWNVNSNASWNQNWNYGWNNGANFGMNWNTGFLNFGGQNPSFAAKEKTPEELRNERRAKAEKIAQNNAKIKELTQQLEDLNKPIQDENGNEISRDSVNTQLEALKNGKKKEDGSVVIEETNFEKMTTGAKLQRGFMNTLSGMTNVFKSLAGYDKDGKWNPLKCLMNVGIAACAISLCTTGVLAPLGVSITASLGGGTLATALGTTVASLPGILAATGVATGGYMAAKGAVNTFTADNLEEFDNATQDIGAGLFIGGSSFMGLKGMGNSAGLTGIAKYNPFAIGRAGMNVAAESMLTAAGESIVYNTSSAGVRTSVSLKNIDSSLWNYIGEGRKAVLRMPLEIAKSKFEASFNKIKQDMTNQVTELESNLQAATASGDTKAAAIIKMKMETVANNLNKLENVNDYASWKAVTGGNSSNMEQINGYLKTLETDGHVEINGHTFSDKTELKAIIKEVTKQQKGIVKLLKNLRSEKLTYMKNVAKNSDYTQEATYFGFKDSSGWTREAIKAKLLNYWQAFKGNFDTRFSLATGVAKKGAMQGLIALDPSYLAYEVSGPTKYVTNILTSFSSPHILGEGKILLAEEASKLETQLTSMQKKYADAEAAIKKEIASIEDANSKLNA